METNLPKVERTGYGSAQYSTKGALEETNMPHRWTYQTSIVLCVINLLFGLTFAAMMTALCSGAEGIEIFGSAFGMFLLVGFFPVFSTIAAVGLVFSFIPLVKNRIALHSNKPLGFVLTVFHLSCLCLVLYLMFGPTLQG
ncbi:MAG: hypothetical protein AAFN77_22300 [Planctomycetota bacterium]